MICFRRFLVSLPPPPPPLLFVLFFFSTTFFFFLGSFLISLSCSYFISPQPTLGIFFRSFSLSFSREGFPEGSGGQGTGRKQGAAPLRGDGAAQGLRRRRQAARFPRWVTETHHHSVIFYFKQHLIRRWRETDSFCGAEIALQVYMMTKLYIRTTLICQRRFAFVVQKYEDQTMLIFPARMAHT